LGIVFRGKRVELSDMTTLALTGGIATGKSTVLAGLLAGLPDAVSFDCDRAVHDLLTKREVVSTIEASLGQGLVDANGCLDRGRLRDLVFENDERRRVLEGILHPLVREACAAAHRQAAESSSSAWFIADVPLLYESNFPLPRALDIVVACGPATQRQRLQARSGFAPALIERILQSQLPIAEKLDRADVVLWNGGPLESLRLQLDHFILWLKNQRPTLLRKPPRLR
jgi:dephospho-CoA kinase